MVCLYFKTLLCGPHANFGSGGETLLHKNKEFPYVLGRINGRVASAERSEKVMQAAGRLSLLLLLISFCSLLNQGEAKAGTCPPERYVTAINDRAKWCQDHESCPGDKLCCPHAKGKVCKTPAGVRPGECPPSINAQKSCNDNCTSDAECAPELKCCFKECGNICMPAMGVSESPGFCPAAAPNLSPCFVPCKNCPSGQKCCPVNCIDECATALSEKPGSCPPTTIFCIQGSHQMCAGDTTCSGEEKCCTYKCGQACMPKDAGS